MTTRPNVLLNASFAIEAAAGEKPAKFSILAYSGGLMSVPGFGSLVVDLAGLELAASTPVLVDHENRLGSVIGAGAPKIRAGKELLIDGNLAKASEAGRQVLDLSAAGIQFQASIGAEPITSRRLKAGEKISVNGQTITAPSSGAFLISKSKLREVSVCVLGCDAGTSVSIAAQQGKGGTMPDETNPIALERERIKKIETVCSGDWGSSGAKVTELRAQAVADEISVEDLQTELLTIVRGNRPKGPAIHASKSDDSPKILEAALCQSFRLPNIEKQFSEPVLQAAHEAYHGRLGIQQLLIQAAVDNGYTFRPGERITSGNLAEILAYAMPGRGPQVKAAFSTLSLPGILSNSATKSLSAGWTEEDQSWREISRIASVKDFKTATSYRLLDSMEYEQLSPAGEIQHGSTSEESYTHSAKTFAKMYSITREQIINDDLGAFESLRMQIGRGAALKFNRLFWAAFMDNSAFFTSGRGNYDDGADTALGIDSLTAAVILFRALETADGKRLGGSPSILLVPPELEITARKLYQSTNLVVAGGGGTAELFASGNPFSGAFRPIVVDWLSDSSYTGYSATAWYLFRDKSRAAPMVVSFLDGKEMPTVESAEADFNTLGIQLRGYHDFGANQAEYLAGIKLKGAA